MPTRDSIGKRAVPRHQRDVPYRTLLPPRDRRQVGCIHVDRPYNTANHGAPWAARSTSRCRHVRVEQRNWAALRSQIAP